MLILKSPSATALYRAMAAPAGGGMGFSISVCQHKAGVLGGRVCIARSCAPHAGGQSWLSLFKCELKASPRMQLLPPPLTHPHRAPPLHSQALTVCEHLFGFDGRLAHPLVREHLAR